MCSPSDSSSTSLSKEDVIVSNWSSNNFTSVVHRWLDRLHSFREAHPASTRERRRRRRNELAIIEISSTADTSEASTKSWLSSIAFGQLIALLAASVNASSFTLEYHFRVDLPMFQLFCTYLLLSIHIFFIIPNHNDTLKSQQRQQTHQYDEEAILQHQEPSYYREEQQPLLNHLNSPVTTPQKHMALSGFQTLSSSLTDNAHKINHFCWQTCQSLPRLRVPWYLYCGIVFLDVLSNYLTLLALKYTSLTSTTLLGSLTVPSTMFVSQILLRKSFQRHHYMGVLLCLLGGTLTLWCDTSPVVVVSASSLLSSAPTVVLSSATVASPIVNGIHISHDLLGDALAMLAAILYGLTDTIAEYSIKHIDRVEYLGILGLFGSMWTALLLVWLEGRQFVAFFWSGSRVAGFETAVATMLWYIGSLLAYYLSASFFLETSDATLLNLSLQAANLWSILVSVLMYQNIPAFGFYVAVILVVSGVVVYECGKLPIAIPSTRSTLQAVTTDSLKAKPQHGAESRACRHYETI